MGDSGKCERWDDLRADVGDRRRVGGGWTEQGSGWQALSRAGESTALALQAIRSPLPPLSPAVAV